MYNILLLFPISMPTIKRYIRAAQELSATITIVLARRSNIKLDNIPKYVNTIYLDIIPNTVDPVVHAIDGINFDAVIPGSEFAVPISESLATQLHVNKNTEFNPDFARNKRLMREVFAKNKVPQPQVYARIKNRSDVDALTDKKMVFPVVVKPVEGAGSFHVYICHDINDVIKYSNIILSYKESGITGVNFVSEALVEQYICGQEFSAECIVEQGKLTCLHLVKKFITSDGECHEIGHYYPANLSDNIKNKVIDAANKVIKSYCVENTILHLEFKLENGKIYIIEVASRIAGDSIPEIIEHACGDFIEKNFLLLRLGLKTTHLPIRVSGINNSGCGIAMQFTHEFKHINTADVKVLQSTYIAHHPDESLHRFHVKNRNGSVIFLADSESTASKFISLVNS